MKKTIYYLFAGVLSTAVLFSCGDDEDPTPETVTVTVDSSKPVGATTTSRMGAFVDQNDKSTKGSAKIVKDEAGTYFVEFSSDFETTLATGTVSVFLAKSDMFAAPDSGSQIVIGTVSSNGVSTYKLSGAMTEFSHVILWCSAAGVPFGNAELK